MTVFSRLELDYLATQKLGRLAVIGPDGAPFVTPVGFRYNPEADTIDIGGHGMLHSKKWRDVVAQPRVAFVVDDVLPPWQPRVVEIRGRAVRLTGPGTAFSPGYDEALIRIQPELIRSFGLVAGGPRGGSHARRAGDDLTDQGSRDQRSTDQA
ncbi:MAG: PPOX class F420-dependent oxidoreductase [Candidatus Limnocylindrales bacterium]